MKPNRQQQQQNQNAHRQARPMQRHCDGDRQGAGEARKPHSAARSAVGGEFME